MPKTRSKRHAIREERRKKRQNNEADDEARQTKKRQRLGHDGDADGRSDFEAGNSGGVGSDIDLTGSGGGKGVDQRPEMEFFGMLSEQEQEYFRSADETLDLDEFPSQEERDIYVANVFAEAEGKELKLACSQSCSRLLERLILLSNTRQKKRLFEQFGTHFLNLMQHRFASHCCETLFLQSAPVVTLELGGERDDLPTQDSQPSPLMEELFLMTLDELEGHLSYLMTDKFASHTLRVILIILSGRPIEQPNTKLLIHSKKKEKISVPWKLNNPQEASSDARPVPSSFTLATKKIIHDSTANMDATALRVLATHPIGNPVLQLLLELDISLNTKADSHAEGQSEDTDLLWRLLPGAPTSLGEEQSPASDLVRVLLYDHVGSRLLETLITHCPGKLFKALYKFIIGPRISSLARNEISCYPAIRVLNRLGKEDLTACVHQILLEIPRLVALGRLAVIKTLFERCRIREATSDLKLLTQVFVSALGTDPKDIVPKLCDLEHQAVHENQHDGVSAKRKTAALFHSCQLITTMLSIPGAPATAIQTSLLSLPTESLVHLATSSAPTSHVLLCAFTSPVSPDSSHKPNVKVFHKCLVAAFVPHAEPLAVSENGYGSKVVSAIASIPSHSEGINLPFHLKEQIMARLGNAEKTLRESYQGRRVWHAWEGDLWSHRRAEWIQWMREVDDQTAPKVMPWKRKQNWKDNGLGKERHGTSGIEWAPKEGPLKAGGLKSSSTSGLVARGQRAY